jgi:lysophospholipase L1-like esterase
MSPRLANFTLLIASVLLALALAEGILRLVKPSQFVFDQRATQSFDSLLGERAFYIADPVLGYRLNPEKYKHWWKGTTNGAIYLSENEEMLTEDFFDVLIIGDSLTEDRTFSEAFTRGQTGSKKRIRFFFNGTPGYNTLQEAEILEKHIGFKPDLVILQFCFNDFWPSLTIVENSGKEKFQVQPIDAMVVGSPFLFKHSALYQFIYGVFNGHKLSRQDVEIVQKGFDRIKAFTAKEKIPLLVLVYPFLGNRPPNYPEMRQNLQRAIEARQLTAIDLHSEMDKCDYTKLRRAPDDNLHPNLLGHMIAARKVWDHLGSQLQLPYTYPEPGACR